MDFEIFGFYDLHFRSRCLITVMDKWATCAFLRVVGGGLSISNNIYTYIHTHENVQIHIYMYIHIHIYTFTQMHIFTNIYIYTYIYVYMFVFVCAYIYICIDVHDTHTCIHTDRHVCVCICICASTLYTHMCAHIRTSIDVYRHLYRCVVASTLTHSALSLRM